MQPELLAQTTDVILRLTSLWVLEALSKGLVYSVLAFVVIRLAVPSRH